MESAEHATWRWRLFLLQLLPLSDQRWFAAPAPMSGRRCLAALLLSMITWATINRFLLFGNGLLITYAVSVCLDSWMICWALGNTGFGREWQCPGLGMLLLSTFSFSSKYHFLNFDFLISCRTKMGDRVLDVCCGSGDLSFLLSDKVGSHGKVLYQFFYF